MKVHARMVIETAPEIKRMTNYIKYTTGIPLKILSKSLLGKNFLEFRTDWLWRKKVKKRLGAFKWNIGSIGIKSIRNRTS